MASKYLISVLIFVFQTLFLHCYAQCPDGYNAMAGMCIYMGSDVPWAKAQATCEGKNSTIIATKVKDQWDQASANIPAAKLTGVWFGLHFDKASGKWTWSDGLPFDKDKDWAPWGTGEPNTAKGECVVVKIDLKKEGKPPCWYMDTCNKGMTTVCVKQQATTIGTGTPMTFPSFPNVTCPPGLMAFAGQCMKYTQEPTTYEEAAASCIANNSYVLFTKDPGLWSYAEYALGSQLTSFWIGLKYDQASKSFKYANGDTYDAAKDWAPWSPDNPGTPGAWAGDCVSVQQDYATQKFLWIMNDCEEGKNGVCLYNMPTTTAAATTTTTTIAPTTTTTTTTPIPTTVVTTTTTTTPILTTIATTPTTTTTTTTTTVAAATTPSTPAPAVATTPLAATIAPLTVITTGAPQTTPSTAAAATVPPVTVTTAGASPTAAPASAATSAPAATLAPISAAGPSSAPAASTQGVVSSAAVSTGGIVSSAAASAAGATTGSQAASIISTGAGATAQGASIASLAPSTAGSASSANALPTTGKSVPVASPFAAAAPVSVVAIVSQVSNGVAAASSSVTVAPAGLPSNPTSGATDAANALRNRTHGNYTGTGTWHYTGTRSWHHRSDPKTGSPAPAASTPAPAGPPPASGPAAPAGSTIVPASPAVAPSGSNPSAPPQACNRTGRFLPASENGRLAFLPFDFDNTTKTDPKICGQACLLRAECQSFDYGISTHECRFFARKFADDCLQFIRDPNFQHFDLLSIDLA